MRSPLVAMVLAGLGVALWASPTGAQFAPRAHWKELWEPVGPADYAILGGSLATVVLFETLADPATEGSWSGGPFLDATARTWLRIERVKGRKVAGAVADGLFVATLGLALGFDPLIMALGVHREPYLAWQLFVVNAEAISVALLLSRPVQKFSRRDRPLSADCRDDPNSHARCPSHADSFYSGQTAGAFAAASAVCMAHARIPLYGGGWGDDLACLGGMLAAATVGALSVASDLYWLTDVLLGTGVGLASGYLLPWLLHYKQRGGGSAVVGPLPVVSRRQFGVAVVGQY